MSRILPARSNRSRRRIVGATLGLVCVVGACGDDGGAADSAPGDDVETFCDLSFEVVELGRADPGAEDDPDAARAYVAAIVPAARQLLAASPDAVRADVATMLDITEAVAETGDVSSLQSPEFAAAETNWHAAGVEMCGWAIEHVVMTEFHFDGIPDTMAPGITSFELSNDGSEFHVIAVFRKNDGVNSDFADLLAQPDGAGFEHMTEVGSGFVAPGQSSYALADLTPGDYIVICPIPVGAGSGPPDAPAHYQEGMQHRFTVD